MIHSFASVGTSMVTITMRCRATRVSCPKPASTSRQWCKVRIAIAASTAPSANGMSSTEVCNTGAAAGGRWAIMTLDGSTASTLV